MQTAERIILPFDGKLLTGPIDDLTALQNAITRNYNDDGKLFPREKLGDFTRQVLDLAKAGTKNAHVWVAQFKDGTQAAFVRRVPMYCTIEQVANTAFNANFENWETK